MSTLNDPRRTQEADTTMMNNEEQNRSDEQYKSISSASDKMQENAANDPGSNKNDARSQTNNPENNWYKGDEKLEEVTDSSDENEKYKHTTDPQEHMQGPVSSTTKAVGEELDTNQTKQEADQEKEANM